jgi:hypothetical protein
MRKRPSGGSAAACGKAKIVCLGYTSTLRQAARGINVKLDSEAGLIDGPCSRS